MAIRLEQVRLRGPAFTGQLAYTAAKALAPFICGQKKLPILNLPQ
jgi:hypothetical protein